MSDHLYKTYGSVRYSPWFLGLEYLRAADDRYFLEYGKQFGPFSALYFRCSNRAVAYIGESQNFWKRMTEHSRHPCSHVYAFELPDDELLRKAWEKRAIRLINPEFNKQHTTQIPVNDHISQMVRFIVKEKYLQLFPVSRIIRVDITDWSYVDDDDKTKAAENRDDWLSR